MYGNKEIESYLAAVAAVAERLGVAEAAVAAVMRLLEYFSWQTHVMKSFLVMMSSVVDIPGKRDHRVVRDRPSGCLLTLS